MDSTHVLAAQRQAQRRGPAERSPLIVPERDAAGRVRCGAWSDLPELALTEQDRQPLRSGPLVG